MKITFNRVIAHPTVGYVWIREVEYQFGYSNGLGELPTRTLMLYSADSDNEGPDVIARFNALIEALPLEEYHRNLLHTVENAIRTLAFKLGLIQYPEYSELTQCFHL